MRKYALTLTFDTKFCHTTGIARTEGTGQPQRNKLCLAGVLSLRIPPLKSLEPSHKKELVMVKDSPLVSYGLAIFSHLATDFG